MAPRAPGDRPLLDKPYLSALPLADLAPGTMRCVTLADETVLLVHTKDGAVHALHDVCTHAYASLSEGALIGGELECPLHGGCFDVRTGAAKGGIVTEDLRRFAVRVENGDVLIALG